MRSKKMKSWPVDDKPALFEELTAGIVEAIQFAYKVRRKNSGKSIPLHGLDAPGGPCYGSGTEMLKVESLEYARERGRNALTEIVGVALRLGMEQGRRISLESGEASALKDKLKLIKMMIGDK